MLLARKWTNFESPKVKIKGPVLLEQVNGEEAHVRLLGKSNAGGKVPGSFPLQVAGNLGRQNPGPNTMVQVMDNCCSHTKTGTHKKKAHTYLRKEPTYMFRLFLAKES